MKHYLNIQNGSPRSSAPEPCYIREVQSYASYVESLPRRARRRVMAQLQARKTRLPSLKDMLSETQPLTKDNAIVARLVKHYDIS